MLVLVCVSRYRCFWIYYTVLLVAIAVTVARVIFFNTDFFWHARYLKFLQYTCLLHDYLADVTHVSIHGTNQLITYTLPHKSNLSAPGEKNDFIDVSYTDGSDTDMLVYSIVDRILAWVSDFDMDGNALLCSNELRFMLAPDNLFQTLNAWSACTAKREDVSGTCRLKRACLSWHGSIWTQ